MNEPPWKAHVETAEEHCRVPNIMHFIFGMRPDFGGRPFSLIHYLGVRSAIMVNRPKRAVVWYAYEPSGPWWARARTLVDVTQIDDYALYECVPRDHYAHRADVARLFLLREHGGIYLDLDVICVRPFAELRGHPCVMGWEDESHSQLSNAVILAEPDARFVDLMLEGQTAFRPGMWSEISVGASGHLARRHPELVRTVPREVFCWPSWGPGGFELMHGDSNREFPEAVCHHLWEHVNWSRGLRDLTVDQLKSGTSNFCRIVRPFIDGL